MDSYSKAPVFTLFKNKQPKKAGFYVLKYSQGREERVYLEEPEHRGGNAYSYAATYFNYRDKDTCCDMGQYVWVNSYSVGHGPTEWRKMDKKEAFAFSFCLFRFGRPSWAHKSGKAPLKSMDDVV